MTLKYVTFIFFRKYYTKDTDKKISMCVSEMRTCQISYRRKNSKYKREKIRNDKINHFVNYLYMVFANEFYFRNQSEIFGKFVYLDS